MAEVTFAADESVYNLLDRDVIMERFRQLHASIIFSCVQTDDWADDSWVDMDGTPFYIIKLPYDTVKTMNKEQVRELMLNMLEKRLQQAA
ncbi:MAG: hypothetical protein JNM22_18640 [Saprospiraceae bacterium]|nr:hypothetical protein [Saprospiraceae bacterium]